MIDAPSLRCGAAACTVKNTEVMLVRRTVSNAASVVPPIGVLPGMPALANTISSLPNFLTPCSIAASVAAMSVASAAIASAFGPSSFAAASSVAWLRPVITTFAPSATNSFAVASPMPLLPPVINAVLFASLMSASRCCAQRGCIIKLHCLRRLSGLILQPHKTVIGTDSRRQLVKRTSLAGDGCPVARALDVFGDWWSLLIIRDASLGRRRFGEFQASLGLAKNILSSRLRTLVERDILKTVPASDGSAYQDYVLTPKGHGIFPILVALRQWTEEFDEHPDGIATIMVDRARGKPVKKLALYSQDGRVLRAADTALKPKRARRAVTA